MVIHCCFGLYSVGQSQCVSSLRVFLSSLWCNSSFPLGGLCDFIPLEKVKGRLWSCSLLTSMVFSDKKIISSFTFHYFSIMFSLLFSPSPCVHFLSCLSLYHNLPVAPPVCLVRSVVCWCACVRTCCRYLIPSPYFPTLDYAEQLRIMQKTKDKLEIALEKHQDCTYLYSCPK